MATLPVYRNQAGVTRLTGINVPNAPRVADTSAIGRGVQALGAGLKDVGVEMERQSKEEERQRAEWKKAQDAAETQNANIQVRVGVNSILQDASDYSGYESAKDIENKQKESDKALKDVIEKAAAGFTSEKAKQDFLMNQQLVSDITQQKLGATYRGKLIDMEKANLIFLQDDSRKKFVETGDYDYKLSYKLALQDSFNNGFLDKESMAKQELQIDKWDKDRLLFMAENDPESALKALNSGEYKLDNDSAEDVKKVIERQEKIKERNKAIEDNLKRRSIDEQIANLPIDRALDMLESNKEVYSDKLYNEKKAALLSAKGIDATTQAKAHARLLLEIDNLPKGADDEDEDPVKYYAAAQNVESEIEKQYAQGKISMKDRNSLIGTLYKEKSKNVDALRQSEKGDSWFGLGGFSYKDADNYIKENYSGAMGDNILLDYFNKTLEKYDDLETDDKIKILQTLIDNQMNESFNEVIRRSGDYQMQNGYPSFKNEAEARKAFEEGKIKSGDRVFINGQFGSV